MKVLKGELTETRYQHPDLAKVPKGYENSRSYLARYAQPLKVTQTTILRENAVTYMSDDLGLHSFRNGGDEFAVSLHLYTPPNEEKFGCHIFDESDGKGRRIGPCTIFYSVDGAKT